jgi:hypothetical protein
MILRTSHLFARHLHVGSSINEAFHPVAHGETPRAQVDSFIVRDREEGREGNPQRKAGSEAAGK